MNIRIRIGLSLALSCAAAGPLVAADNEPLPMVPPAKAGVFTAQKKGGNTYRLILTGHTFTSREAIEKYLAYRAAALTLEQKARWFTFMEERGKGDSVSIPQRDPAGYRYSFRLNYFRPLWRYRTAASQQWQAWSPFSGQDFFTADPGRITEFEVVAQIALHDGRMDSADPLGFEADALSDLLINQVSPPQ